jgi:hypothetical protein
MIACGYSSQEVLYIDAPSFTINVGERISLTAQATELLTAPPEWEVQELDGGTIMQFKGQQVTYMAPPHAGRYHVIARASMANGQKVKATQVIVVQPQITIEPASLRAAPGGTYSFNVKVKGIELPKIQWSVEESDGGSISASGLYTAPTKPGFYHIVATAQTEWQSVATATVRVD